jgi:hypothetical protein
MLGEGFPIKRFDWIDPPHIAFLWPRTFPFGVIFHNDVIDDALICDPDHWLGGGVSDPCGYQLYIEVSLMTLCLKH